MREAIYTTLFAVGFSAAGWFCLTETLTEMTQADCQAGIVKACEALKANR